MIAQLAVAFFLFLISTGVFFGITNNAQKEPYMDELFHVPQAQQYCAGNFTKWDPMITTLPGLYIASLLPLYPIGFIFSKEDIASSCTPLLLRSTNILFSVGNLYLLYLTTYKLHYNKKNGGSVVLTALTLATFPVLYFFTWLYYTDAGSTFFSLLTYLCVLHKRHRSAAVCGLVAILFRQTNVVWVMFGAGVTAGQVILNMQSFFSFQLIIMGSLLCGIYCKREISFGNCHILSAQLPALCHKG
ncbi:putative Dol-P-Glc:Glc(2)Man(9)GlcNAc(2)-PP-Dol alpha-1,2-glucosyltransferase isoform X6 [Pomacea canaliculata]|uniref:putative Dol-P-Glc:Glc(2)Man(9)GlcNAc(2)-PP-Dol alpha-1,2-glucosyltransferase isoform X6 n=1 Tax=Pomacea canaliculata TaxID=400727 RepID=UPI000D727FC5|nr:putative Dol-P-Glc:Glc(2)Man(9)GlcNAc(2)-PP-Dol alpha-1,2-glucosyltransferase isoform X6 [Pomacea canaliculata]